MKFKIEEIPTINYALDIKDLSDKKIGVLKVTWRVLPVDEATQELERIKDVANPYDGDEEMRLSTERLPEMRDYLHESLKKHLGSWNLTDEKNNPYDIDDDILEPLLNNQDYFWPLWRNWEEIISQISWGVNIREKLEQAERKNSRNSGKRGNRHRNATLPA